MISSAISSPVICRPLRYTLRYEGLYRVECVRGVGEAARGELRFELLHERIARGLVCEFNGDAALVVRRRCGRRAKFAAT
jgi:hypothetical protein